MRIAVVQICGEMPGCLHLRLERLFPAGQEVAIDAAGLLFQVTIR
jgi:hypothetical protein